MSGEKLRIAMLSYHTCPLATLGGKNTGGMNVYVRDLARQLGRMGVGVDVFTRSQDEHVPHVLHDLGFGNRVVHVPAGPERPLPKEQLAAHLPQFVDNVCAFARQKGLRYHLIHSHYWMSGVAALRLRDCWGGVPVLHMFHTLGIMKNRVAQNDSQKEGSYRVEGERRVLEQADRIVAATPAEVAQLQWLYHADTSKIVAIPPGVDTSRFYPIPMEEAKEFIGVPASDRMLLFVGRIEPLKGLDILIQAVATLRERPVFRERHFCLAVVGGEPHVAPEVMSAEMSRLQEMRLRYGLEDFVLFLGKKGQDTLPYYYSAADAVVVPSHYESFGMVALEAMACGTPVVASQVGGLAFLVQDGITGYHVPVGEPDALADRLEILLKDDALRARLGRQAVAFARSYAWEHIAARLVEQYRDLVHE